MSNKMRDVRNAAREAPVADIAALLHLMQFANGEIRIKAARYCTGWHCLVTHYEPEEQVIESWGDLTCGDQDYFDALNYFEKHEDFVLHTAEDPTEALNGALLIAAERMPLKT